MMTKGCAVSLLVLGAVHLASACDGPWVNRCDADGCEHGEITCPSACAFHSVQTTFVRPSVLLCATPTLPQLMWKGCVQGVATCTCSGCVGVGDDACEDHYSKEFCDRETHTELEIFAPRGSRVGLHGQGRQGAGRVVPPADWPTLARAMQTWGALRV